MKSPSYIVLTLSLCYGVDAFQASQSVRQQSASPTALDLDRRGFGNAVATAFIGSAATTAGMITNVPSASAQIFLDPAMYGDQELRVAAVDSVKERVRRAILKKPSLVTAFYRLSLLDGLSFDAKTREYGPDGGVIVRVLAAKAEDAYTASLQEAALVLLEAEKQLKAKTAVSIADAVAIGGSAAIEAIGGPVLAVQLGRMEPPKGTPIAPIDINLLNGKAAKKEVTSAFLTAGLTEREMTALLGGLLTLEMVEKSRSTKDWMESSKPQFRERGKMGRMSEFKRLTDEDIAAAEMQDDDDDEDYLGDEDVYIADSFGTRTERFGKRIAERDIDEKTFNRYMNELSAAGGKKGTGNVSKYGWIGELLMDTDNAVTQTWVAKYAGSNLNYLKDLGISFSSVTQLGAVYTGGKYESLLKNKSRKTLNDDLSLF